MEPYRAISDFYRGKYAKRSKVPYINHIDEGLLILDRYVRMTDLKVDGLDAMCGFCLHPIFQSDEDVITAADFCSWYNLNNLHILLAMEYRHVANNYLSKRKIKSVDEIQLSPILDVNLMLIADKAQNKKDFDIYHKDTHPRTDALNLYFSNWLTRLGISSQMYTELIKDL